MSVPVLRTPRLTLRGLDRSDTEAIVGIFADPAMSRYLAADLSDPGQCRAMIERRLAYRGPVALGHWVIERDGVVIGLAHLRPSDTLPDGTGEIGYFLDPAHSGQGFATEAAAALLEHGLVTAGLPAVWALIHQSNVASLKLARRLGFHDVGAEQHYGAPHRVHIALPHRGRG
ncbi:GNAT family N-acetyltransferase [Amycolatopsis pithecellobii]|uniref:GNAT family N-acetyltransferase n=1 Tax=Amycolatopsis pithecellobii TaxID=664692 RepID=A0A6N7Z3W8_9PSEU|nr:GNAT family N-acetyltransferase [Amycolatopsis pithecellobii]MTD55929.1 GNAT family N-acetyltransferase [Amycolatopsis pithecellobii]